MLISIVIAEDHGITRKGLQTTLEERLEARIAATTGDGREVLPLVQEHSPDLLVLDLGLPGLGGIEILKRINQLERPVPVVVLSMHDDDTYVVEALNHGASAYVLKGAPIGELFEAIRVAVKGDRYLSEGLPTSALFPSDPEKQPSDRYSTLTEREREVLQLVAEGYTSNEIGGRLDISSRTVDKHRENLKSKLELHNTAQLTRFYLQRAPSPDDPESPQ